MMQQKSVLEESSSKKIVVVGSINFDIFLKVPRMPEIGETILGTTSYWAIGGKGANQAVGIARLGESVSLVAKVGKDPFQQKLISQLKDEGVNTRYVAQDRENPSGMAVVFVDENGRNSIAVIGGANRNITVEDIRKTRKAIVRADMVVLQLEIPVPVVEYTLRLAREFGVCTILNPAPASALDREFLSYVDILIPNRHEAEMLSGRKIGSLDEAKKIGLSLVEKGVKVVILTLDQQGALLVTRDHSIHVPGIPVKPVDTTGAGDAFVAAFAAGLKKSKNMEGAVRYANYAASISVTRPGAQKSLPSVKEMEALVHRVIMDA